MHSETPKTIYLKDYTVSDFLIDTVHLHFDIHDDYTDVKALLKMQRNPRSKNSSVPLVLMGEDLSCLGVSMDGKPLASDAYEATSSQLTISTVPNHFLLETRVRIYPQKNKKLMGLYQSRHNLCTQCEAEGFRRITYYLDRPDVMACFTTTMTADKNKFPFLLSNGNLIEERALDQNRQWVHWEDPSRKPCYLFALVVGDFDVLRDTFTTMSGRNIDLFLYLEKGFLDQGDYAMISLKKAMKWDEERFGREYDLNRYMIVAVSDFNMGAMENKGLNIFNTKYILAKPMTATDGDYIHIEAVIGHEYFHNWSGNRITCRDWFQLTLKEGLTVFRDQLFTEDMTSYGVARIDVVNVLRNQQFPEDAGPMAHPIRPQSYMKIDNFYTATVYNKGAEVIRMIRTLLTPDVFRQGMDLYFARYDGQAVTTEDFVRVMEEVSGKDFSQFRHWYDQAGTPVLMVDTNYDAHKKTFSVTVKQQCPATPGQPEKNPFHLPFAIGLMSESCRELPLQLENTNEVMEGTAILEVKKRQETFTFIHVEEKPVPSLLRHFSAPVEVKYDYSDRELALLLQCDTDPFCRWEAAQRLAVRVIESVADEIVAGRAPKPHPLYLESIAQLIRKPMDDLRLLSRLLRLPSLKYLLSHLSHIEVDVIFSAKQFVERILAGTLKADWVKLFEKQWSHDSYRYDAVSCGRRDLKYQCLLYLLKTAETEENQYFDWALNEVQHADNMSDKLGALIALNDFAAPHRGQALHDFYELYQHEPLAMNKWLAIQASTILSQALEDVKRLMYHPAFDRHNPNSVYALLVTFGENTLRFHDDSGQAYRFIADQTLALDAENPQVAARVVQPLTRWQQIDASRSAFMKAELARIASHKNLSENLFEIVTKSLL